MILRSIVPILLTFGLALPFVFADAPFIALAVMGLPMATLGWTNSFTMGVRAGCYVVTSVMLWSIYALVANTTGAASFAALQLLLVTVLYAIRIKTQENTCRKQRVFKNQTDHTWPQQISTNGTKRNEHVDTND